VLVGPVTSELYLEKIRHSVSEFGLEKEVLILKGMRSDDPELVKAYRAADVFILPSIHEPFGIVVLEAWASDLPVIAAATGGLKKLVKHGENGLLFDGSLEDLYRKYWQLSTDGNMASALRRQAAAEVRSAYTWKAVTEKLLEYYQEIIEKYKRQRLLR
jgi:glycosyltransferase involved in cell wall biosynthesis